jgi:hypothetical protein
MTITSPSFSAMSRVIFRAFWWMNGVYVKKPYIMGKIGLAIQGGIGQKIENGAINSINDYQ